MQRINHQWSDERKIKLADVIIVNDDAQPLIRQVEHMLLQLA
jgi:dephospho-CoA kinase